MNEALENQLKLSSRKRRIAAFMIDHFVMTFLIVGASFLSLGSNFIDENRSISEMAISMLLVMVPGFLMYFAKDSIKGISVGKWVTGIMVRDANNYDQVPSFGRLFLRNLFIVIWPVEFIVLATSREKKRIGDTIAKTVVIKNPNKPTKFPRIITLIGVVVTFILFLYLLTGTAIKNSDAYKVAIQEIEQNDQIVSETGGIIGYGMLPGGSLNLSNGNGEAYLDIKVLGNEKDMNLSVYLTKSRGGEWSLIEINQ